MARRLVPALLLLCVGCAAPAGRVIDAFPTTSMATPWVLQNEVWSGSFDQAAPGLGDEADTWRAFHPTHAWLAIYCHERHPGRCLTARCFAFATPEDARQAYLHFRPEEAQPFDAGDDGCWTPLGIMFLWDRLVGEVFGPDDSMDSQLQSGLVAGFIINDMPPDAPRHPR